MRLYLQKWRFDFCIILHLQLISIPEIRDEAIEQICFCACHFLRAEIIHPIGSKDKLPEPPVFVSYINYPLVN